MLANIKRDGTLVLFPVMDSDEAAIEHLKNKHPLPEWIVVKYSKKRSTGKEESRE